MAGESSQQIKSNIICCQNREVEGGREREREGGMDGGKEGRRKTGREKGVDGGRKGWREVARGSKRDE